MSGIKGRAPDCQSRGRLFNPTCRLQGEYLPLGRGNICGRASVGNTGLVLTIERSDVNGVVVRPDIVLISFLYTVRIVTDHGIDHTHVSADMLLC